MESPRQHSPGDWRPAPEAADNQTLPEFLAPLIEHLAEKVHDKWADRRIAEGWTYGPRRDDERKQTPNLVPYDKLTEVEKAYDRATAVATIRNLYAAGFRLVPGKGEETTGSEETIPVENFLADPGARRLEEADLLWRSKPPEFWRKHPALLVRAVRTASDAGWPLLAYDMVSRTLAQTGPDAPQLPEPEEAQLRYLGILSMMEVGALERAAEELDKIDSDHLVEGDLQGLRGRLAKMRGLRAKNPEEAKKHFREAQQIYASAYREALGAYRRDRSKSAGSAAYYLGINAATMGAWAGDDAAAHEMAGEVLKICDELAAANPAAPGDPWLHATRGEAHLLRKSAKEAGEAYRAAAGALHKQWRPLLSMRRQALETAKRTGVAREEVERWFAMPRICVRGFPGSPTDEPPRGSIVFFFLHDASQLAAASALAPTCAEFHLGFENPHAAFRESLDAAQLALLDEVEASCTRIIGRKDQFVMGEQTTPALARLLFRGAVLLRAQELDLAPEGLPSLEDCLVGGNASYRALVCADAKGYSRLDNTMLKTFVRDFLGCVGRVAERYRDRTVTVKTAGDGLFAVFRELGDAIRFCLELRDSIARTDWAGLGLPADLGLRISLDAVPMLEFTDPVTGRTDVAGRLVNRAARIEPITPVNHVYASRTLASLALALGVPGVRFEYAGETPLPKGFGAFQLYHLTAA
jgi:class 3 adenylate cyclase